MTDSPEEEAALEADARDYRFYEAIEYKQAFQEMAYYFCRTMEGDDVTEEAYPLMRKYGLVDEDGFWIHEGE